MATPQHRLSISEVRTPSGFDSRLGSNPRHPHVTGLFSEPSGFGRGFKNGLGAVNRHHGGHEDGRRQKQVRNFHHFLNRVKIKFMNQISKPHIVDLLRIFDKNRMISPRIRYASVQLEAGAFAISTPCRSVPKSEGTLSRVRS